MYVKDKLSAAPKIRKSHNFLLNNKSTCHDLWNDPVFIPLMQYYPIVSGALRIPIVMFSKQSEMYTRRVL